MSTNPAFEKFLVLSAVTILSGCVAMPEKGGDGVANIRQAIDTFNPFDKIGPQLRSLVDAGKFDEAHKFFIDNYETYYRKRFIDEKRPVTTELEKLGTWLYESDFKRDVDETLTKLKLITVPGDPSTWANSISLLRNAASLNTKLSQSKLLAVSHVGETQIKTLDDETQRANRIFSNNRWTVFASTFDNVVESGQLPPDYPGKPFLSNEYLASQSFQEKLEKLLISAPSEAERNSLLARLADFVAPRTKKKLTDTADLKKTKDKLLADGRIDLDELGELRRLIKEHGANSGLEGAVKVGYLDLTASSFRDRNVFDFEIAFSKDYGINIEDAKEVLLGSGKISDYDYIFVTDLSAAKIFREFKNKREMISKTQTGTRQEPNPDYVKAMTEYQQAMANMQKAKVQNAIEGSKPCYGNVWACALGGVLRGAVEGSSESTVRDKSAALAATPQNLTKPVYSKYGYHLVDISAAKNARVDYYVIDVKKKKFLSSFFEIKDHEKFTVSYNVEENDPDKSSILRNNQKEDDVTAWEKKPVNIKLSDLFDPKNLAVAPAKPFTTVEAFLKPLSARKYASASPTYSSGTDPKTVVKGGRGTIETSPSKAIRGDSATTIADERFDSVVLIKNASSIGTGFYVTPDVVLTAYHVVDKANLVEMTFYDGTKTYGKVIDHDVRLDLALVKAQTTGKPVKIHSGAIKLGETVEAIGHPKGYEFTITRGVVSAVRKQSAAALKTSAPVEFVQTDTPISPGNSGGPLFLKDAVIGVNDWVRVDKASQNLNFSVSFNEVREYLNRFEGKAK